MVQKKKNFLELKFDRSNIGKTFKKKAKELFIHLDDIKENQEELLCIQLGLQKHEKTTIMGIELTKEMIQVHNVKKQVSGKKIRPSVIEPAFGIGRIIYCLLEQSFCQKPSDEGALRTLLTLKPNIAPVQCAVFALVSNEELEEKTGVIIKMIRKAKISQHIDTSSVSIGRRYARVDELGCPFCVTVDYQTLTDNAITIRERDSTEQIRVPIDKLINVLEKMITCELTWNDNKTIYPIVKVQE